MPHSKKEKKTKTMFSFYNKMEGKGKKKGSGHKTGGNSTERVDYFAAGE